MPATSLHTASPASAAGDRSADVVSVPSTLPTSSRIRRRRSAGAASASVVALTTFGMLAGLTGTASAATKVDLGAALEFGVLGTSGISNTGVTTVEDDIGADNGAITGADASGANSIVFIDGGVNRGNDTAAAQLAFDTAFNDITYQGNGQVVGTPDLGAFQTEPLTPDIYSSASTLNVNTPVTLDGQGSYDSVFIFRAGSALNVGTGGSINLINGAQSCNIFWQVQSAATLLAPAFAGNVLAMDESITLGAGVTVDGRLLAGGAAVTLINDTITQGECLTGPVVPVVVPPVVVPPVVVPPVVVPPVDTPPTTTPPTTAGPNSTPHNRTTFGQVRRVPVGSVDTGDGSTS
jgi:hypothetical protein